MREIKFRGRDLDTGRFVYGYFIVEACGLPAIITTCPAATYEVDPKSVAQLVGYDANGNEVYEGDIVIQEYLDGYTKEHVARLESMSQVPDTNGYYFWTSSTCTLKGGDDT